VKQENPMARRVPLKRSGPLGRGEAGLGRRVPLKQVSARRAAENRRRRTVVDQLFPERPGCRRPGCARWADDIHEPLTRARGGSIVDPENMVPLCREHHDEVTFRPESELQWAYDLGLLVHSWNAPKAGEVA